MRLDEQEIQVYPGDSLSSLMARLEASPGKDLLLRVPAAARVPNSIEDFQALSKFASTRALTLRLVSPVARIVGLARIYGLQSEFDSLPAGTFPGPAASYRGSAPRGEQGHLELPQIPPPKAGPPTTPEILGKASSAPDVEGAAAASPAPASSANSPVPAELSRTENILPAASFTSGDATSASDLLRPPGTGWLLSGLDLADIMDEHNTSTAEPSSPSHDADWLIGGAGQSAGQARLPTPPPATEDWLLAEVDLDEIDAQHQAAQGRTRAMPNGADMEAPEAGPARPKTDGGHGAPAVRNQSPHVADLEEKAPSGRLEPPASPLTRLPSARLLLSELALDNAAVHSSVLLYRMNASNTYLHAATAGRPLGELVTWWEAWAALIRALDDELEDAVLVSSRYLYMATPFEIDTESQPRHWVALWCIDSSKLEGNAQNLLEQIVENVIPELRKMLNPATTV